MLREMLWAILWEILSEILWETLVGNSCRKILWEILVGNAVGNAVGNFWHLWEIFKPITTTKTLSNYFYLVEEVLGFDLVGQM